VSNVEGQTGAELVSAPVAAARWSSEAHRVFPWLSSKPRPTERILGGSRSRRANHSTDNPDCGLSVPRWDVETMKEMH